MIRASAQGARSVEEVDVYIRSFRQVGEESPELGLVRLFHLQPVRAAELVQSIPRTVKRRLAREAAERYAAALREIGAEVELRPCPIVPQPIVRVSAAPGEASDAYDPNERGRTLSLPPPAAAPVHAPRKSVTASTVVMMAPAPQAPLPTAVPVADRWGAPLPASAPTALPAPAAAPLPAPAPAPNVWSSEATNATQPAFQLPPEARALLAAPPSAATVSLPAPRVAPAPVVPATQDAAHPGRAQWVVDDDSYRDPLAQGAAAPADVGLDLAPGYVPQPQLDPRAVAPVVAAVASAAAPALELDHTRGTAPPAVSARPSAASPAHGAQPRASVPRASAPRTSGVIRHSGTSQPIARASWVDREPKRRSLALYIPKELLDSVRIGLRVVLGFLLFFSVASARACSGRSDVEEVIASWSGASSAHAESGSAQPQRADPGKLEAVLWCASEMHQFSTGDKDVVRNLIERVVASGGVVTVGGLMKSGLVTVASQLVIELPDDRAKRRTIFELLRAFRTTVWHQDPGENDAPDPFYGKRSIVVELG